MRIRIALIDDHRLFREGLRAMLATDPDLEVVAEASTAEEAIPAVRASRPQVVILDVLFPRPSGIEIARVLLAEHPAPRILALSMATDPAYVADAFRFGILGYATKRQPVAEVLAAIHAVARGERYLAPELSQPADARFLPEVPAPLTSLTAREREIFGLCVEGRPTRAIAAQLAISPRTVETHRARVLHKLGARTTADLVRMSARWGLLHA